MAISLNPATRLISIPQADLTFVSGNLYTLDTDQFRKDVNALLSSEPYVWLEDAFTHNTQVTVAGITYARTIEFINGYSIQFEFTGSQYSVRLEGSNNNIFDVENGILVPTSLVTVIPTNSGGLIVTDTSGLTITESQEMADIHDAHFNRRQLSKAGDTITLYEDDGVTPKQVFDTNTDVETEGITEIDPQ